MFASRRRAIAAAAAILIAALVALRAFLPYGVERYVTNVLSEGDTYSGGVGDIDLALWRGAYTIHDLRIEKQAGGVAVPFLLVPKADVSIRWLGLFRGQVVGEAELDGAKLNFVAGPSESATQTGRDGDWRRKFEKMFPLRIERLRIRGGEVHFRNPHADPPVDVYVHEIQAVGLNLGNATGDGDMPSSLALRGRPMNRGELACRARFDLLARIPTFDFDGSVRGADLRQWNSFLRAYAGVDVQRGQLSVYAELLARDGGFEGYVKPFFEDVDVLQIDEEWEEQSPFATLWEAVVELGAEVFKDQSEERIATRIPIAGVAPRPELDFWTTLANVLRNAFVESFVPRLEGSVGAR